MAATPLLLEESAPLGDNHRGLFPSHSITNYVAHVPRLLGPARGAQPGRRKRTDGTPGRPELAA